MQIIPLLCDVNWNRNRNRNILLLCREMKANVGNLILIASIGITTFIVIQNYEYICESIDIALSSSSRQAVLSRLKAIKKAIGAVEDDAAAVSRTTAKPVVEIRREWGEVSVAIDFLFSQLDDIRGDEAIKGKRKQLVDRLNSLTQLVEIKLGEIREL